MYGDANLFPEGIGYWEHSRGLENTCEQTSLAASTANSEIVARLGTITSLLYRLASCYWGCHGKEHVFEYLAGRTTTSTNSAFRLMNFGYYDEALNLTRSIAEIGNLTHLFFVENAHMREWLDASDGERRSKYSPVQVRKSLEALGSVIPTDQDTYAWLCQIGTHVSPMTRPQAHNADNKPVLGQIFQRDGLETTLNALAWSVCTVSGPTAKLAVFERRHAERLVEETIELVKLIEFDHFGG